MLRIALAAVCCQLCVAGFADEGRLTEAQKAELSRYFGFGQMEIYKIKPGISNLVLADLNVDGRKDALLWNAHQSRFEVFYQPGPNEGPTTPAAPTEQNEIASRGNLRHENVPVPYRVAAVEVADVTADGRPDIIFFGDPKELVILPGKETGGFGPPVSVRAPDGEQRSSALVTGDFNHDGPG